MRARCIPVLLLAASACVPHRAPKGPPPELVRRLGEADALMRAGCLDCFEAAYREYEALRQTPGLETRATAGAFRAALLIVVRERELGLPDAGYLERAELASGGSESARAFIDAADAMPSRGGGRSAQDDEQLARARRGRENHDAWLAALHPHIPDDPVSAYLWLGVNCAFNIPARERVAQWTRELTMWDGVPLLEFKKATCGAADAAALGRLLAADSRFVEVQYFLSIDDTLHGRMRSAGEHLQQAHAWRPRWPAVTNALANLAMASENFEQAARLFDETLAIVAADPEALLGRLRALSYLARYADALPSADRLIALNRWNLADARYWRAYDLMQLDRLDEAWDEVERAEALHIGAEVAKLAGLIAYRRRQLDVARAKFDQAHTLDDADCEAAFYLGATLAELGDWQRTNDVLVQTCACLDAAEARLTAEIETIRGSSDPPERQQRLIERRQRQLETGRRLRAGSWFHLALANYNLSHAAEARAYAEKVAADAQFGERARELLARIERR